MRAPSLITLPVLALGLMLTMIAPALALETKPYDAESFKAAQSAGKPLLVHVHAPWCPTCKAQQQVLKTFESEPAFDDITVFTVDFDNQKDAVKSFGARSQSTLIAYKGDTETGRSAGNTSPKSIESLLMTTLK